MYRRRRRGGRKSVHQKCWELVSTPYQSAEGQLCEIYGGYDTAYHGILESKRLSYSAHVHILYTNGLGESDMNLSCFRIPG